MNWYNIVVLAQGNGIQTVITKNKFGNKFFTIMGNTFDIKEQLGKKGLGFRYFQGTWGYPAQKLKDDAAKRQKLEELGVNTSILDAPGAVDPEQPQAPGPVQPEPAQPGAEGGSPVQQQLAQMKAGIQEAQDQAEGPGSQKAKALLAHVDKMIDQLASQVDEAAASDFVRQFLEFASKFHNYSFGNQILIWIQKPDAIKVAGAKQWMTKFGRQVTNWQNKISIIAPRFFTTDEGKKAKKGLSADEWNKIKARYERIYFVPAVVYDVSDTEPIEGWTDKNGNGPYEPGTWRKDSNDPVEELTILINAAWDWASKVKEINIDTAEMQQALGGYSAGGEIRVNDQYDGINKFSTLIHEIAHELIHWAARKSEDKDVQKEVSKLTKTEIETDAESTAWVVLKHYGFDSEDTPNYIALWRGTGQTVKDRRETIARTVKTIINGIDSQVSQMELNYDEDYQANDEA